MAKKKNKAHHKKNTSSNPQKNASSNSKKNASSYKKQQPVETAPQKDEKSTLSLIATIIAIVAGFCGVIFMCCLGVRVTTVDPLGKEKKALYLIGMFKEVRKLNDLINTMGGSAANPTLYGQLVTHTFAIFYCLAFIIVGVLFGSLLIIKTVRYFKTKDNKDIKIEKLATICFMLFAGSAVIMRSLFLEKGINFKVAVNYAGATLAGLIIGGICLGVYVLLKLYINKDKYLGNKKVLINASFNLGWAVLTVAFLVLLALAPIKFNAASSKASTSFFRVFTESYAQMDALGKKAAPQEYGIAMTMGFLGFAVQVWLVFQGGFAIQSALGRAFDGTKPVSFVSQILCVFASFFFMIFAIAAAKNYAVVAGLGATKISNLLSIFVLVLGLLSLALAIVHKVLFKLILNDSDRV